MGRAEAATQAHNLNVVAGKRTAGPGNGMSFEQERDESPEMNLPIIPAKDHIPAICLSLSLIAYN